MKLPSDNAKDEQPCEPEWVALNHLFSYCAKSRPARTPNADGEASGGEESKRCTRKTCLFGAAHR